MAKTKISQFDATAANNTDLNSISIAEGTAPSNINNAIRELMSQLADLNLGNEVLSTLKIDNLHLDGNTIVTLDTNGDLNLTPNGTGSVTIAKVDINGGAIDGTPIGASSASTGAFSTLSASSTVGLGSSVTISGGNINGVIGANTPAAITGTVITANTNFAGNLTGNVTGNIDGIVGGSTPAAITGTTITANTKFAGALEGNVTAASGTSTFNNVTINGTLDMDSTTSQTITGLATPSGSTDAATKGYVDTEVSGLVDSAPAALDTLNELAAALGDDASFSTTVTTSIAAKLPLAGGTMTGDINANSNTVSGLKAPSGANDATTKTYVDTADALKLNLSGGTLSGNLAMGSNKVTGLDTPTATGDATTKGYVDGILGSATAAATSASAAATSATASASSATASASSATASASSATSAAASYDSFDDRYLGAKGSAPTVDNDGDALLTGALYFNTSSNQLFVWTSGDAWTQAAFTASGFLSGSNNLSDVDSASTSRTNLGLAIGSNVQAFDADLSALAGLTSAADKGIQFTGSGTAATYDLTSAGKALLDDATATAQRTTLGLGSVSTLDAGTSANNAVQLDGSAKLPAVDGSALTGMASGGTVSLVADGAITAGKPTILTAAGKAKQITQTSTGNSVTEGFATENQFNGSDAINYGSPNLAIIGTNKVAVCYRDAGNSNYAAGRVAEVAANGDLTFATAVVLNSAESAANVVGYNSSNSTVAFGYTNASSNAWYVKAGTISGTTLSLSSEGTIETSIDITQWSGMVDPDTGHFVIFHTGGGQVYATAVTISGTNTPSKAYGANITGTTTFTNSGSGFGMGMDYDTNINRFLLTAGKDEPESAVKFWVVANSGSAFTVTEVSKAVTNWKGKSNVVFDPDNNKMILSYNNTSTQFSMAQLTMASADFTIDHYIHTSISNDAAQYTSYCTDANTIAAFIGYGGSGGASDNASFATFTNDGSAFTQVTNGTWDEEAFFAQRGGITKTSLASLSSNPIVIIMSDAGNSGYARSFSVGQTPVVTTDLTNSNYLGVAAETISDTNTGKITVNGGVNENQTGLTIGDDYFSDDAGNIKQFMTSTTTTSTTDITVTNASAGRQTLAAGTVKYPSTVYDTGSDRFVTVYTDAGNSDYGTAVVYQITNATTGAITYGTPVVFESAEADPNADYDGLVYDANADRVVIAYQDRADSRKGKAIVGNVTAGTNSISFGTAAEFEAGETTSIHAAYDSNANKTVIIYRDADDSNKGKAVVATIAGNLVDISFGTIATFHDAQTRTMSIAFDSDNNKFLIVYEDDGNTQGEAVVGTISSTDITFGTVQTFTTDTINYVGIGYDENVNKFLISYSDAGDSHYSKMIVATIAGTDVSFGSEVAVASEYNYAPNVIYDSDLQRNAIAYYDSTNDVGRVHYVSISSTTPSVVGSHTFDSANIDSQTVTGAYDVDNDKLVLTYKDEAADLSSIMINAEFTTTTTYTQTDSQFIGKAIAADKLLLEEQDHNIIYGKASNTIAKGNPVIVEADGDFAKVTSTGGDVAEISAAGFTDTSLGGYGNTQTAASDGNGIVAVAYKNTSNYPSVVLGSMATNGTITWGSARVLSSVAHDSENLSITYAPNYNSDAGGFYISSYRASNTRQIVFGITFSGTTSSYGNDAAITSLSSTHNGFNDSTFDTTNNKAHIMMLKPYSAMFTVTNTSGTSLSVSSLNYVISGSASSNIQFGNVSYDNTNNTGVIVFRDEGNSDYPTAIAYTISGDTFTFGSKTVIETSACYYIDVQANTGTNKTVVAWATATSSATMKYVTLDYSGTTITVNTVTTIGSYTSQVQNQHSDFLTYSPTSQQFYLVFNKDDGNGNTLDDFILLEGKINSSDSKLIDWTEKVNLNEVNRGNAFTTFSGQNNLVLLGAYYTSKLYSSSYGGAYSDLVTNFTTENFIGLADNASTANGTSKIRIGGVDANQSSLTAGQLYYVKNDATLSTTAESGKTVEAGKALSTTKLLVNTS